MYSRVRELVTGFLLLVLCLHIGKRAVSSPERPIEDAWYNPPPDPTLYWNWPRVPENQIVIISGAGQLRAQDMLVSRTVVTLTAGEYERLAGMPKESTKGAFLVRGFESFPGAGGLSVTHKDEAIHLNSGLRPSRSDTLWHRAVIVLLDSRPKKVYVSVSRVE